MTEMYMYMYLYTYEHTFVPLPNGIHISTQGAQVVPISRRSGHPKTLYVYIYI